MDFSLDNTSIVAINDELESFLMAGKAEEKNRLRIQLTAEEILLKYQERFGEGTKVSVRCIRRLGRMRIELSFDTERFNPFEDGEDESLVLHSLLASMGAAPLWQYRNGRNVISFTPRKKKRSQMVYIIAAVILALGCGIACLALPDGVGTFISSQVISPLLGAFMGLLSAVSGPMIFCSVLIGICSIGDTATLGRIGKLMMARFLIITLLLNVIVSLIYLPFFDLSSLGGSVLDFSALLDMMLGIIPGNLFTPFTEGNPLQIISVAVMLGISIVILGQKVSTVMSFFEQVDYIIQLLMEAVSTLVPFFVFGSIFNMIVNSDFAVLMSSSKFIPIMLLGDLVIIVIYIAMVSLRKGLNPMLLIRKIAPTFLIAITTDSSAAAFSTNVECCEKDLGIDKKIISFGIPLGQVVFMPGASILFLAAAFCMAEVYGVSISLPWLVSAITITFVLAVAAPPIPGGALICYTMLMTQLGLPDEAIAIAIAFNVILEFVATAFNLSCLQLELVELSGELDMLDREVLRSNWRQPR